MRCPYSEPAAFDEPVVDGAFLPVDFFGLAVGSLPVDFFGLAVGSLPVDSFGLAVGSLPVDSFGLAVESSRSPDFRSPADDPWSFL